MSKTETCPLRKIILKEPHPTLMGWTQERLDCGHVNLTKKPVSVRATGLGSRRCVECGKTRLLVVCFLDLDQDGKVLAISRKSNSAQFGLIGGKVDPEDGDVVEDELNTLRRACARETLEEAGMVISPKSLYEVHRGMDVGADGKELINVTFKARRIDSIRPQRSGEGQLKRMTPREMLEVTPFYNINLRLFKHLRLL